MSCAVIRSFNFLFFRSAPVHLAPSSSLSAAIPSHGTGTLPHAILPHTNCDAKHCHTQPVTHNHCQTQLCHTQQLSRKSPPPHNSASVWPGRRVTYCTGLAGGDGLGLNWRCLHWCGSTGLSHTVSSCRSIVTYTPVAQKIVAHNDVRQTRRTCTHTHNSLPTTIVIHRLSHATLSCNIILTHNCVTHSSITQHAKHSSMTQRPSHTNNSVTQRHFLDTALHARFCSSWLFICAMHMRICLPSHPSSFLPSPSHFKAYSARVGRGQHQLLKTLQGSKPQAIC